MNRTLDQDEQIRKIEDIIDIQKAKGKFTERQVAFHLPSDSESTKSAILAKSLDSGLSKQKAVARKKKYKKRRSRRRSSLLPDVVSWPSDSDVTVLRMKLCNTSDIKDNMLVPGDGLHHPDSSSMVNLATLMMQSHSLSKHSLAEEYLMPLTSWEEDLDESNTKKAAVRCDEEKLPIEDLIHGVECQQQKSTQVFLKVNESLTVSDSGGRKSKMARFLRLYFCPCCTCLYKMENQLDDSATYDTTQTTVEQRII